jgi:hypothetical protein
MFPASASLTTVLSALLASPVTPAAFTPHGLWEAWPAARFVTTPAPCLRHAELTAQLEALVARHAAARAQGLLALEEVGRSVEGRAIRMLTVGRGPKRVLLWSQMHGDEPSATPALLDLADFLLARRDEAEARAILGGATLLVIPMLNPDGAERYERRNAQGIDVNRDALSLATPEGRALEAVRDRHEPVMGFNLHDQNRRTAVGDSGRRASIALLAVAGDPEGTLTPGRARTKRACAALVAALSPFVPGAIARYDEDWSPRAFGDNLTKWGTPVVLIESGALPPAGFADLTRLNFVGLLSVLRDLVRDDLGGHDPASYEALARNQDGAWADVIVRAGSLLQPGTASSFRADLAFDVSRRERDLAGCGNGDGATAGSTVVELGDARFLGAGREIDAAGRLVVAPWSVAVEGLAARSWLDAATLDALARLGVGGVRWYVAPDDEREAAAAARTLAGPGRPSVSVRSVLTAARPRLRLDGRPVPLATRDLRATLLSLDAHAPLAWLERGTDALTFIGGLAAPDEARFAPGGPASFVLLRTPPEGSPSLERVQIEAVWLDGHEVPLP